MNTVLNLFILSAPPSFCPCRSAVFSLRVRFFTAAAESHNCQQQEYQPCSQCHKDKQHDPICHKRGEKLYVQVTYLLASDETIQREFGVYDSIRDNFPKYVVSLDEFDMSRNGIKHRNIRDFLLTAEWN